MDEALASIDKDVYMGKRMNTSGVLVDELAHCKGKAVVLVSGPASMADDARAAVCKIGRKRSHLEVKLVEEAFSW